jgi:hypothetical protein
MWYKPKKRKPLLQLRILKTLALQGKLSKMGTEDFFKKQTEISTKTRPHYPEISDAYDALLDKELVERLGKSEVRGRPYRLKEKGLQVLINECSSFEECWTYAIGYSIHFLRHLSLDRDESFDNIVDMLLDRFLPYKSVGAYSNILEPFNVMSKKLITELKQDNFIADLLILLSKKKDMTIKEIALKTSKDESNIKRAIQMLSMDCSNFSNRDPYTSLGEDYIFEDPDIVRLRYIDFLKHLLIFYYDKIGTRYYNLSLFGVLFLVTMLSENARNPLSNRRMSHFETMLDLFASIYPKKLSLVFNKWDLLKQYLNLLTMYNFEFVLYNDEELSEIKRDIVTDYDLIKDEFAMRNLNKAVAQKILDAGTKVLKVITKNNPHFLHIFDVSHDDIKEIKKVINRWKRYLDFRIKFVDIEASLDSIFDQIRSYRPVSGANIVRNASHHENDIEPSLTILEKALGDEVTLAYYINLLKSRHDLLVVGEELNPNLVTRNGDIEIVIENPSIRLDPFSPRQRLKVILSEDNDIRDFVLGFLEDSTKYHGIEFENIKRLSDSMI